MALIEREALLEQIERARRLARTGVGALLAIVGEAGAGKTSLVRAATAADPAVWGYCEPLATPRPLGPFLDIGRQLGPRLAAAAEAGVAELREALLAWAMDEPEIVLIIEDAHWIDDASADILRFLGRRVEGLPLLILVTYRDEQPGAHPWRRVLGDLATVGGLTRVSVPPLSAAGVGQLAAGSSVSADEALRLTGGNAFLLSQLVPGGPDPARASLRDSVTARLLQLDAPARELVELLSVIPGRVTAELVGNDWVYADEAATAGLLRVDGSVVEFRHELVRLAVADALTPGRRRALHDEVLGRLLTRNESEPAAVAFHARGAQQPKAAYEAERSAGRHAAELGAHRQAAEHYRRALADADQYAEPAEISQLWSDYSAEEFLNGADASAIEAARRALDFYPVGSDAMRRGGAISWLSRVSNTEAEALQLAWQSIEILEPIGASPALAGAYANLANQLMRARDLGPAVFWARRTIELAREIDQPDSLVSGLDTLGCSLMLRGRDPSGAYLREAITLAREAGLENGLGRSYVNLVSAAGEARLYRVSMGAVPEALAYFIDHDLDGHAVYLKAWQARCRFEQGEWAAAESTVLDILEAASEPSVMSAIAAWCVRGRVATRRGGDDAWAAHEQAKQIADRTGALQRLAPVVAGRSEARWLDGIRDDGTDGLIATYELAVTRADRWAAGELGFWMWRHGHVTELPDWTAEPYRRHVAGDLVEAAKLWRELGCPYEQADALCDVGDEPAVRAALELYDSLGAQPGRRRAVARLRDLGVRAIPRGPRASTAAQADGLTAREVEVLQCLRSGRTDAEISATLHLSARTVGHHVSAILRKMGVRSRRELLITTETP